MAEQLGNKIIRALNKALENVIDDLKLYDNSDRDRNKSYMKAIEEWNTSHHNEKKEDQKNSSQITEDNSVIYTTESSGYKAFLAELDRAQIPAIAFSNNIDYTVIVAVPKQYEIRADDLCKRINKTIPKTEISEKEFTEKYFGQEVVEHKHLNTVQVDYIRKELRGSSHEFCVQKMHSDDFRVLCSAKQAKYINPVVFDAIAKTKDPVFENEINCVKALSSAATTIKEEANNYRQTIILRNAATDEKTKPVYYMLDNKGLYEVTESNRRIVASRANPEIVSIMVAKAMNMRIPMVKVVDKSSMEYDENIFSKEDIKAARMIMATDCAYLGKPEQARVYAEEILRLTTSVKYGTENRDLIDRFNTSVQLSYILADEKADKGDAVKYEMLKQEYEKMNLSTSEQSKICDFLNESLLEYTNNCCTNKEITINDLNIGSMKKALDAAYDNTFEHSGVPAKNEVLEEKNAERQ